MLLILCFVLSLVLAAISTIAASTLTAKTKLKTINGKTYSTSTNTFLRILFVEPLIEDLQFTLLVRYNISYSSVGYNVTTKILLYI